MKKFWVSVVYGLCWALAWIPLPVLYLFSDILICPLVYYILGYRKKVVRDNLQQCFPDKTEKERRGMERRFYRHFCDIFQETIHLPAMSKAEIRRRVHFVDFNRVKEYVDGGRNVLIYLGHYANWEYQSLFVTDIPVRLNAVYKPLHNTFADALLAKLRRRENIFLIPKKQVTRELFRNLVEHTPASFGMLSDQSPADKPNSYQRIQFLNRPTAVMTGVERLARKTDSVVVYADVIRLRRGHYENRLEVLTEHPAEMPEGALTELYARKMEATVLRAPEYWLWSHRRWKF